MPLKRTFSTLCIVSSHYRGFESIHALYVASYDFKRTSSYLCKPAAVGRVAWYSIGT